MSYWYSFLACPACKAPVVSEPEAFICRACYRNYPIRYGIPDFRLFADPYISMEEELRKIEKILGHGGYSFEELVDRYYEFSPEVSAKLQPRYKRGLKGGRERALNFLDQMEKAGIRANSGMILEIGCGTAPLLVEANLKFGNVLGIDIALRWLILGRQRLREAKVDALLICANAEALPFQDGVFQGVLSDSTLEHSLQTNVFVKEMKRVTRPGGFFFLNTANRYSLLESYTGFPLAGIIPRKLRWKLVETICQTPYQLNPISCSELAWLLQEAQDLKLRAFAPLIPSDSSILLRWYDKIVRTEWGNKIFLHMGFFIAASGRFAPKMQ